MPKQPLVAPGLAPPNGHFSQATVAGPGRLVFISGMTARRADGTIAGVGDITEQTHQVCRNLAAAVEAAGGTLDDIARVDVYVRDIGDFAAIHEVRRRYFTGEPPASTMVEVSRFVHDDYLIEINAIAVLGGGA
ncbi:RidA family protein [Phytohabitans sp. ZYX-F-186]|uniref:RidA family protein n=1 Tax=Phytohabitans maris TaxID=3071409 RepID=A0ABU0ZRB7_9ACTN|nr:RidA family protein [Phytohabitans sp. ZYX-F-186]MDQ7909568.1 RidA family protein [Phytohabitans sp. ZYX-F-186]